METGTSTTPIPYADASTPRPLGPVERWCLRPLPKWVAGAIAAIVAWPFVIWPISPDWLYLWPFVPIVTGAALTVVAVLPLMLRAGVKARVERKARQPVPSDARAVLWGLAIGWAIVLLVASSMPVVIAFHLGRGDFERARRAALMVPPGAGTRPMSGGLYGTVTASHAGEGGVFVYTSGSDCGNGSGFLYVPPGSPMPSYNAGSDGSVGGGWHWFTTD